MELLGSQSVYREDTDHKVLAARCPEHPHMAPAPPLNAAWETTAGASRQDTGAGQTLPM